MSSDRGKKLAILAGIIVLVALLITSWFTFSGSEAYGIGLLKNLLGMLVDAPTLETQWGIPAFTIYILLVVFLLLEISWVLLFLGAKSRIAAIIGAIMPIFAGYALIASYLGVPPDFIPYFQPFLDPDPLLEGIIPLNLRILRGATYDINLGAFLLLIGGVLGLASGFMDR